jgi:hypothetical protein
MERQRDTNKVGLERIAIIESSRIHHTRVDFGALETTSDLESGSQYEDAPEDRGG